MSNWLKVVVFHIQVRGHRQVSIIDKFKRRMGRKLLKKGETPDQYQTELYDKITKVEAEVLQRIQKLKGNSKSYVCEHFSMPSPDCEPYNPNVNYYDKFWKRFLLNEIGKQNLTQVREKLDIFNRRLVKIDDLFKEWQALLEPITKGRRRPRKPEEGEKEMCNECGKGYRDLETLMIHKKIKHEREEEVLLKKEHEELDIFEEDGDD